MGSASDGIASSILMSSTSSGIAGAISMGNCDDPTATGSGSSSIAGSIVPGSVEIDMAALLAVAAAIPGVDPRIGNNNFGWQEGGLLKRPAAATPQKRNDVDAATPEKVAEKPKKQVAEQPKQEAEKPKKNYKLAYSQAYHKKLRMARASMLPTLAKAEARKAGQAAVAKV